MRRFIVRPEAIEGSRVRFDPDEARHLGRVLRLRPGALIEATDGTGRVFTVRLGAVGARSAWGTIVAERAPAAESPCAITLAQAILKGERMAWLIQKATELGVARIVPLLTEYSVPAGGLEHEKAHAWPGQLLRAAKQCRRSSLPELLPPMTLEAFLVSPILAEADLALRLDDVPGPRPAPQTAPRKLVLVVGPEGGFSPIERNKLDGLVAPWMLGGRVLRAETAVLVGLAAVHLAWGDFRP